MNLFKLKQKSKKKSEATFWFQIDADGDHPGNSSNQQSHQMISRWSSATIHHKEECYKLWPITTRLLGNISGASNLIGGKPSVNVDSFDNFYHF